MSSLFYWVIGMEPYTYIITHSRMDRLLHWNV